MLLKRRPFGRFFIKRHGLAFIFLFYYNFTMIILKEYKNKLGNVLLIKTSEISYSSVRLINIPNKYTVLVVQYLPDKKYGKFYSFTDIDSAQKFYNMITRFFVPQILPQISNKVH